MGNERDERRERDERTLVSLAPAHLRSGMERGSPPAGSDATDSTAPGTFATPPAPGTPMTPAVPAAAGSLGKKVSSAKLSERRGRGEDKGGRNTYLSRKVREITSMRTDEPDFIDALAALSSFYDGSDEGRGALRDGSREGLSGANTGTDVNRTSEDRCQTHSNTALSTQARHFSGKKSRHHLRRRLESHGVRLVKEFLHKLAPLRQGLEKLSNTVESISEHCDVMVAEVDSVSESTARYSSKLRELEADRRHIASRAAIVEDFLERVLLSNEQEEALLQPNLDDETSANEFFQSLERLQKIRGEVEELSDGWARTSCVELLQRYSDLQSKCLELLFHWIKKKTGRKGGLVEGSKDAHRDSDGDDILHNPAMTPVGRRITRAIQFLQDRPAYFEACCAAIVESEKKGLRFRFLRALSQGGASFASDPIDVHSHDPFRFINDMLAWMHSAIASEYDALRMFVGKPAQCRAGTDPQDGGEAAPRVSAAFERVKHILPAAFDGAIRPLKVRINETLRGDVDLVTSFKLCDLIGFYVVVIGKQLPEDCAFMRGLESNLAQSHRRFQALLESEVQRLSNSTTMYPADFSVPRPVRITTQRLKEICFAYANSMSPHEIRKPELETRGEAGSQLDILGVVNSLINAVKYVCDMTAGGLRSVDKSLYFLNNFVYLATELREFKFLESQIASIDGDTDGWINALVSGNVKNMLASRGIFQLLARFKEVREGADLSKMEGFDVASVRPQMSNFVALLFSDADNSTFQLVADIDTRRACEAKMKSMLAATYSELRAVIMDPQCGYTEEERAELIPYSPAQVNTLLDL